jgi:poly-gamma-glutamate synthesis protein (capsule biosynthesis protein)
VKMTVKLSLKDKIARFIKRNKKKAGRQAALALTAVCLLIAVLVAVDQPVTAGFERDAATTLVVTMVGDIMFDRHVRDAAELYGYESLFRHVEPLFLQSDYSTANFEQPVVSEEGYLKAPHLISFRADAAVARVLRDLNFTTVNLANNHMMDYGAAGLRDTRSAFAEAGLGAVGAGLDLEEARQIDYRNINGVRIATLGFSNVFPLVSETTGKLEEFGSAGFAAAPGRAGVLTAKPSNFVPLLREARQNAELVIVHLHMGQEYNSEISDAERELARTMADLGADIIIGHHPHVLKPVEIYNGAVILYSLGNFIFYQGYSRTKLTAVAQYKLSGDGRARLELTPLRISDARPRPLHDILSWGFGYQAEKILTKELGEEHRWTKDGERIVIPLNNGK